jgi:hypothetical protein
MEPISLTAGAIATLVLTKAFEKTGEVLGEKALEQSGKLMQLLKRKSPNTATAIEVAAQHPELAEQQPEDYGEAVLEERVELAAKADPEVAAAVQALADAVKSKPSSIQKIINIAENNKGNVAPGGTISVENQTFNF